MTCRPGTYGAWDPGGGPWIVESGCRAWFHDLAQAPKNAGRTVKVTWADILDEWASLELDFQDWGIDLPGCLSTRSWRWFSLRIYDLYNREGSRLQRSLAANITQGAPPDEAAD